MVQQLIKSQKKVGFSFSMRKTEQWCYFFHHKWSLSHYPWGLLLFLSQISPLCSVPQVSHLERDLRSVAAEEGGREEVTMRSLARILGW